MQNQFNRRQALKLLGMAAAASAAGCGSGGTPPKSGQQQAEGCSTYTAASFSGLSPADAALVNAQNQAVCNYFDPDAQVVADAGVAGLPDGSYIVVKKDQSGNTTAIWQYARTMDTDFYVAKLQGRGIGVSNSKQIDQRIETFYPSSTNKISGNIAPAIALPGYASDFDLAATASNVNLLPVVNETFDPRSIYIYSFDLFANSPDSDLDSELISFAVLTKTIKNSFSVDLTNYISDEFWDTGSIPMNSRDIPSNLGPVYHTFYGAANTQDKGLFILLPSASDELYDFLYLGLTRMTNGQLTDLTNVVSAASIGAQGGDVQIGVGSPNAQAMAKQINGYLQNTQVMAGLKQVPSIGAAKNRGALALAV